MKWFHFPTNLRLPISINYKGHLLIPIYCWRVQVWISNAIEIGIELILYDYWRVLKTPTLTTEKEDLPLV